MNSKIQRAVNLITVFDVIFLLFLSLSGGSRGVIGTVLYYLAFIIPLAAAFLLRERGEQSELLSLFSPKGTLKFTLPIAAPLIGLVMLISYLTSLLLSLFNFSDTVELTGNIFYDIFRHALLPSVFEELLFRLVPMLLLSKYSKKNAVFISSLFFALIHCNLFQIPYALLAGLVLTAVTAASGSIIPAIILHFLNNLASVLMLSFGELPLFNPIFFSAITLLTLISIIYLVIKRKLYGECIKEIFSDGCKLSFTLSAAVLVLLTMFIAVSNLFIQA